MKDALAVVTGATEGIGRAIAFHLGRAGARLAICARTAQHVDATVAALHADGIDAIGLPCDVAEPAAVHAFAEFVGKERGDAAVLVNNAGIGRFRPLEELSLEDWDTTIAVNLRSLYLVTRAFLPGLKRAAAARGSASIVNIASLAGRNGFEGGTAYCASKHAVLGFSKALMLEVRKQQVRVIAICPGSVATPFMDKQDRMRPNRERVLTADDVAQAVLSTLTLPDRAMVSELDIRPTNP
jgi:3-oxoacyl-[acyl-carrier protein] reductase